MVINSTLWETCYLCNCLAFFQMKPYITTLRKEKVACVNRYLHCSQTLQVITRNINFQKNKDIYKRENSILDK